MLAESTIWGGLGHCDIKVDLLSSLSSSATLFLVAVGCCCWVAQSCPTLCDPMDCSTPKFPVIHYLLEFAQTHVHWVGDAIQPSHPLLSLSPPAFNLSQNQGLFQWVGSLHQVVGASASASVLPMNIQGCFPIGLTEWSPCCPKDSQESSLALQFESISSLVPSLLYGLTVTSVHDYWKNHNFD